MTILVAGIGNVFLGDDGFGVEAVARLRERAIPDGVEVADFGIRGLDLAYALMDGYSAAILVDALPHGECAGTVYVMEPDLERIEGEALVQSHAMNPLEVLRLVRSMGGRPPRLYLVGCEPAVFGPEEGLMSLSPEVEAAVEPAVAEIQRLLTRLTSPAEVL